MIVRRCPQNDLEKAEQAWFDSDAKTNDEAVREIDDEAAKYGLVRVREYWLQTFLHNDQLVRRGFCYRPEPSGREDRLAARRGSSQQGAPSDELVREMRDQE